MKVRLLPSLVVFAASAFVSAPAGAQGYYSITGCSVEPAEVFLAPGESATLTLSVDEGAYAWTTIVSDGVVVLDELQPTSDITLEFTHDMFAAQVTDSSTQTWWAVDGLEGTKVGSPLCSATISLASAEIPVVGSTMMPVVLAGAALLVLGALLVVVRRRIPTQD